MQRERDRAQEDREMLEHIAVWGTAGVMAVGGVAYAVLGKKAWQEILKHPNEAGTLVWEHLKPAAMTALHVSAWTAVGIGAAWLGAKLSQLYFRYRRRNQLRTYEIILSRDDTTEPFEMTKFFDAVNAMLLPRFRWQGWLWGYPYLTWEQGIEGGASTLD